MGCGSSLPLLKDTIIATETSPTGIQVKDQNDCFADIVQKMKADIEA